MPYVRALYGLFLLFAACGPPAVQPYPYPLDAAELRGNDGWRLSIHGDGSGSLRHRQFPLHHLDYPPRTFDLRALARAAAHCDRDTATGFSLAYYSARSDREWQCACGDTMLLNAAMTTAIDRMQLAVDDAVSERSCRMLRRAWLVSN
ncbi:hypothetical protein [Lewinella sp. IMCC34183]|uniref:hypothetical protein n=1 Tax=Lewinella sp. IMCC34183 TaxID=2248762 RepID=UPI000E24D57B|nr:hypothetical protein [Lewinella sp. IMCC34183]